MDATCYACGCGEDEEGDFSDLEHDDVVGARRQRAAVSNSKLMVYV